jgi:bifunctional non-homologous end joining protein LigD
MSKTETLLTVENRQLPVSNLDKILYPKTGFTKGQVVDYYIRISHWLLPHLKNRALTLKRYPNGVDGLFFYEKRCPSHRPSWVKTAAIWSEGNKQDIDFCLANDLPTLVWAANLADLELHTSLSFSKTPLQPAVMVFDLDPGPPAHIIDCSRVGLHLRKVLLSLGLEAFAKTTGSKGLQLYVPLNTPCTYDQTKDLSRALAEGFAKAYPNHIVHKMAKALRPNKIFIDWSQNDNHKTTVCVYSLRAKDQPTVSTPVSWDELATAIRKNDPDELKFVSDETIHRAEQFGDLFEPVLTIKQKIPRWDPAMIAEAVAELGPLSEAGKNPRSKKRNRSLATDAGYFRR